MRYVELYQYNNVYFAREIGNSHIVDLGLQDVTIWYDISIFFPAFSFSQCVMDALSFIQGHKHQVKSQASSSLNPVKCL